MRVKDVMTTPAVTVSWTAPLADAVDLMIDQRLSGLAVVDENGRLRGMLSESDLLHRVELGTNGLPTTWWERLFTTEDAEAYRLTRGRKVWDVHKVRRLPVTHNGDLVGVLSRADFVKALRSYLNPKREGEGASDEAVRDNIQSELSARPWTAECWVEVEVNGGAVTLRGVVDGEDQHRAVLVAAETTAGVRAVTDHLSVICRSKPGPD